MRGFCAATAWLRIRTVGGWEGLSAAQQAIRDPQKKTDFARNFARLAKAWEIVSPDEALKPHLANYTWLASVYQSVRPVTPGSLIWTILGAKTIEIIHQNIDTDRKSARLNSSHLA